MARHEEAHKEHINKYKMAHMIGVAEYMRERAEDYGVDPDKAYAIGLLHDIGYLEGRANHETSSRTILESVGVTNDTVLDAIAWHGTDPYKVIEEYGEDYISDLLVLIYEADMSVNAQGYRVGFAKRFEDIESRLKGTEYYEAAVETARNTQKFVIEWCAENEIPSPRHMFCEKNHER